MRVDCDVFMVWLVALSASMILNIIRILPADAVAEYLVTEHVVTEYVATEYLVTECVVTKRTVAASGGAP